MPPTHVCRCGGTGWDGCPPRRRVPVADPWVREQMAARLSAAGPRPLTIRDTIAAVAQRTAGTEHEDPPAIPPGDTASLEDLIDERRRHAL
jgi:hypothetical protein